MDEKREQIAETGYMIGSLTPDGLTLAEVDQETFHRHMEGARARAVAQDDGVVYGWQGTHYSFLDTRCQSVYDLAETPTTPPAESGDTAPARESS